jgi:hypothetical protein
MFDREKEIEVSGAKNGGVKKFEVIGRGEGQEIGLGGGRFEAEKKLLKGAASMTGAGGDSASGGDGVEMLEEHDHGGIGASEIKDAADVIAGVCVDELPTRDGQKVAGELACGGAGDEGLTAAARAVQEDAVERDLQRKSLAGDG